jgi:DNA-binding transcriptional regulator YiaG
METKMSPDELREAIAKLGLNQLQAATILGVGGRTMRSWLADEYRPPWSAGLVLRLALEDPKILKRLKQWSQEEVA